MENKVEAGVEHVFVCVCGRQMEIERAPARDPAVLYSACTHTDVHSDRHTPPCFLALTSIWTSISHPAVEK